MAKNPNVQKMKAQRTRRKLGTFRTYSDPSTIDPGYLKQQTKLRQYWGERVSIRQSTGPNGRVQSARGVNIPDDARGTFMNHSKTCGVDERYINANPREYYFLNMMFPGARFVSAERAQVLAKVHKIIREADPTSCLVMERTRFRITYLYYNPTKTLWWLVEQDRFIVKSSITYGSQERARAVHNMGSVKWQAIASFQPDSS